MIDALMAAMKAEVIKHGFTLLDGPYKNDLLVIDKEYLERSGKPGMTIGWVLGDSHTHLLLAGIHPEENSMTDCYLRLSSSDQFYMIELKTGGQFILQNIGREKFHDLRLKKVEYHLDGSFESGCLMKGNKEIGRIRIETTGGFENRKYHIHRQPAKGISEKDRVALEFWSEKCAVKVSHTLFCRTEYHELESYEPRQAKAA